MGKIEMTSELQKKRKEAGRKGGMATYAKKGRAHYANIGKKGGETPRRKAVKG